MRILLTALSLPLVLCASLSFQKPGEKPAPGKPGEKPAAQDPANPITSQMLAPLEQVAHGLAKGGRETEMKDLLAALEKLGYPKNAFEKLELGCKGELSKAKIVIDSLPAGAKQLKVTAKQLAAVMQKLEGDAKTDLAKKILLLDGEIEEAQTALGHVKIGRHWMPADQVDLRARRAEIFDAVQQAHELEVDMETGEVDEPLIQRACGVKATFVRRGQIELRSNFSVEKTTRILRESLRASALSQFLRRGELKLPPKPSGKAAAPHPWVLIDSRERYLKLAAEMAKSGEMTEADAKLFEKANGELGTFNTKSSNFVVLSQIEGGVETELLRWVTNLREGVLTPLTAGHLNWVALSCLGQLLPSHYFKEDKGKAFQGETHVENEDQKREREERLRVAKSGIAGSRSWMRYLAERGEDPPFARSLVDQLGMISGDDLHKCTSIVDYLQEAGLFAPAYKLLSQGASGKPMELYKGALDMSVGDLEAKWHEWILLGGRSGVAERIDKQNANAWPADALAVLKYMNDIREKTFKGKIEGVWQLRFDPELSEQCAAHAHYLTLHPEQQKWPDAHEEYADKEGFSVEGAWAGAHSVIVWKEGGLDSFQEGIDVWMGSFYHRLPLVDPGVLRLGWGAEEIYAVMDMSSLAAPAEKPFTVIYPYDGQKDVPTAFLGNEFPDPVPDGPPGSVKENEIFGYPVTLQTNPVNERGEGVEVVLKLFEGKDGKVEVPCHFSSPEKPTNPELAPPGAWCLIPKTFLKVKTDYKVVADIRANNRKSETAAGKILEWTFKTN